MHPLKEQELKKEIKAKLKLGIYDYNLLNKYDYLNDNDIIPIYDDRRVESQWEHLEKHNQQK